jgi:hypothetical protein
MKKIAMIVVVMSLLIAGCAATNKDGYSKPTIMTNPLSYLDSFPLGKVSKESVIGNLGIPDKTSEFEGKTYYSYELGEGYGKRQYVYELTNSIVTDVRYNDQGPYNGSSAKQRQSE